MEAPETAIEIKAAVTAVIAFGTALFGMTGWLILLWIVCMVLDYLSGTWAALKAGEWSSAAARQGLWHKLGSIVAVCVAALCDIAVGVIAAGLGDKLPFDYGSLITPVVALWYLFTEAGSIVENAVKLGAPVPAFLVKMIEKARSAAEDAGEEISDEEE